MSVLTITDTIEEIVGFTLEILELIHHEHIVTSWEAGNGLDLKKECHKRLSQLAYLIILDFIFKT